MNALLAQGVRTADIVICEEANGDTSGMLAALASRGFRLLSLSIVEGEANLDPYAPELGADVVVAMSAAVYARLTGEEPVAPADPARVRPELAIDWEVRSDTGWGVYGTNLALELLRDGRVTPIVHAVGPMEVSPLVAARLAPLFSRGNPGRPASLTLRALGNRLQGAPSWEALPARRNAGVIFFEDTELGPDAAEKAARFDLIVAGSSWNAQILEARGIGHVVNVPQGIDPSIFHPAPRAGLFGERFVIFSGGKLEYRKGQDLVVAAFRRFAAGHPEALLVLGWHNAWPTLISDLDLAGHVQGQPTVRDGHLVITSWLAQNGVSPRQVIDIGRQPNALMGQLIREADVALFPNRCEGGTNLVAMECMAAGVPTIVSANTGHLDLIATGGCIPMKTQTTPSQPTKYFEGIEGWGESNVDEIVDALEHAWTDRDSMKAIAARGAEAMTRMTWQTQVAVLLNALEPLL
jgi:glycosyltransferase involved in cell wall biosynthesis